MSTPVGAPEVGAAVVALALAADATGVAAVVRAGRRWRAPARVAAMAVLAVPLVLVAASRLGVDGERPVRAATVTVGAAAVVGAAAGSAGRRRPVRAAVVLVGLGWAATVADLLAARERSALTLLGWRGLAPSTLAAAVAASLAIALASGVWGWPPRDRVARRGGFGSTWTRAQPGWLAVALGVLGVTVAVTAVCRDAVGTPVLVALVPASLLVAVELAGGRVHWRRLAVVAGAAATVVGVIALVQLTSRPDSTTLGTPASRLLDGTGWPDMAARVSVAGGTGLGAVWLALLVGATVVLGVLASPRRGAGRDVLDHVPGASAHLHGVVLFAALAWVAGGLGPLGAVALVAVPWVLVAALERLAELDP